MDGLRLSVGWSPLKEDERSLRELLAAVRAYRTPLVSGKDSMKNDAKHSVKPKLKKKSRN